MMLKLVEIARPIRVYRNSSETASAQAVFTGERSLIDQIEST